MTKVKRQKLATLGYRVTDTQEFLGLSDGEMALIELKLSLIKKLREIRAAKNITQQQLARMIHSSQSRVAMLERGKPDVSLDLICKSLFALGLNQNAIGRAIDKVQ
jgi:DNA-binding XRE family transcriptional regulator